MLRVALVLITTVILAACSSAPPKPSVDYAADFNFGGVTKIGFYALSGKTSGDNPMGLTDFQKNRISDALSRALQGRGFEIVDNAADAQLLLSWHLNAVEKQDTCTTTTPGYGMGVGMGVGYSCYNRYAMYSCYSCFDNTEVRVSDYTQGTFIVNMIDNGARIVLQGFPPGSAPTAD